MKKGILHFLKGTFLTNEDAFKNWRFILFVAVLAGIMISSAHRADKKVHELARLNEEVLELRSEFVDVKTRLQQMRLESNVMMRVSDEGLAPTSTPPNIIRIVTNKE